MADHVRCTKEKLSQPKINSNKNVSLDSNGNEVSYSRKLYHCLNNQVEVDARLEAFWTPLFDEILKTPQGEILIIDRTIVNKMLNIFYIPYFYQLGTLFLNEKLILNWEIRSQISH